MYWVRSSSFKFVVWCFVLTQHHIHTIRIVWGREAPVTHTAVPDVRSLTVHVSHKLTKAEYLLNHMTQQYDLKFWLLLRILKTDNKTTSDTLTQPSGTFFLEKFCHQMLEKVCVFELEAVTSYIQVNSTTSILLSLPLWPPPTSCFYKYLADFALLGHAVYYNSGCHLPTAPSTQKTRRHPVQIHPPLSVLSIWLEVSSNWFVHHKETETNCPSTLGHEEGRRVL